MKVVTMLVINNLYKVWLSTSNHKPFSTFCRSSDLSAHKRHRKSLEIVQEENEKMSGCSHRNLLPSYLNEDMWSKKRATG